LNRDRELLYNRINERVEFMFDSGLVKEVESLIEFRQLKALQTVGYKEVFEYLDSDIDLETCKAEVKKNTRRYAKRQMTWFRNQVEGHVFQAHEFDEVYKLIQDFKKE